MFKLKPISSGGIPGALKRADHYRMMNEYMDAESICRDILLVEPENQKALVTLLLALTGQFETRLAQAFDEIQAILPRIQDPYFRHYYQGVACERRGKAHLRQAVPGAGTMAYEWLVQAMQAYDTAMEVKPAGNDDAVLRWNTCARIIMQNRQIAPSSPAPGEQMLE